MNYWLFFICAIPVGFLLTFVGLAICAVEDRELAALEEANKAIDKKERSKNGIF